jgi:hypothetical protein
MGPMTHARATKLRFVARASRRAASTVVSTFFSAVTAKSMRYPLFSTERSALG